MSDIIIKAEGVGKSYLIDHESKGKGGYVVLRDVIAGKTKGLWSKIRSPRMQTRKDVEEFWALKGVSFEVKRGDRVGIIGRNGAGKSTLLKVLSRITEPTKGRVSIKGRVASLLEVGTGFHPELTGRENIYLNGAILGMTRQEIRRKFDEIVDFAEVEKFLDTPVKRYSSGMYVRLAFAVAAYLEPEILVVDEVLAVGDAQFQKKCLGKMSNAAQDGRTVLFVSHNMAAIRSLCQRTLLIDNGQIVFDGPTSKAIDKYFNFNNESTAGAVIFSDQLCQRKINEFNPSHKLYFRCEEVSLLDSLGKPCTQFKSNEEITIVIKYRCYKKVPTFCLVVMIENENNEQLIGSDLADHINDDGYCSLQPGLYESRCVLSANLFGEKHFYLNLYFQFHGKQHSFYKRVLRFDVLFQGYNVYNYAKSKTWKGYLRPKLQWQTTNLLM